MSRAPLISANTLAICIRVAGCSLAFAAGVPESATAQLTRGIVVDDSSVWVTENGGTYTQQVRLAGEPTADVTVQVASGNTSAVRVSPATLTFTPTNYNINQQVTYTGVDDNIRNQPPAHRSATVTYTATGANYGGISHSVTVLAIDDEPIGFAVQEGRSYRLNFAYLVEQGCAPATIDFVASDSTLLGLSPQSHSWNEQDSNRQKAVRVTFHYNNALGDHRVSLERRVTVPCGRPFPFQEIIFIVRDNDTWDLSAKGVPACGATVTDTSVQPQIDFLLKPAPAVEMATEYRPISEDNSESWQGSLPITTSGRSISFYHSHLSSLRRAFPGFKGFEYRLKDAPDVTAQCTWQFTDDPGDDDPGDDDPRDDDPRDDDTDDGPGDDDDGDDDDGDDESDGSTPTVRLSASPNPVDEGNPVTVTAWLSEAPENVMTVPLVLTAGTAEPGRLRHALGHHDRGRSDAGHGHGLDDTDDADRDDETFTVALGSMPSSVSAGSPGSLTVMVRDTTPANEPPAFGQASYRFELRENVDGRRRPVALGTVEADDPDGNAVTYTLTAGGGERFAVGAEDGVVRYAGSGEDYETEPNRYEMTLRARDRDGAEASAQVVVYVINVNELPEAEDDRAETAEDVAVVVDVLANDTDPDGDVLRIRSVSAAAHGSTAVGPRGVVYTPEADYHGTDRFTYVVADGGGETAEAAVEVTVAPVNDAPLAVGVIPDQLLDEGGGDKSVDVGPFFEDIDGDALSYRASSSDADVVVVSVAGALVTLTPVVYGSALVTVTAEDPDGLTAEQTFAVGVSDRLARAVLGDTLAAMARSHLASARMTLGRRASANGAEGGSRLRLLGRSVPLDAASAQTAAAQLLAGWAKSPGRHDGWRGGPGVGYGPSDGAARMGAGPGGMWPGMAMGLNGLGPDGGAVGSPPAGMSRFGGLGGFGMGMDPLRSSEFELALGGAQDEGGETRPGRRWQLWGQGDVQAFAGAPSSGAGYEGDVRTGYVGVDTGLSERWLAGVAVSRSGAGGDWRAGSARGTLSTSLTAAYPYVQWSEGPNSVWAAAGTGWGMAENLRESGRLGTSDLRLRLALVEVRRRLDAAGGVDLTVRADASWAELRTAAGDETVDRQSAAVNQARAGAEVSRPMRWEGGSLSPFGELHVRRDGGAGQTGTGLEVVAGTRLAAGRVRLDAQGRLLVLHSASGYRGAGSGRDARRREPQPDRTVAVGSAALGQLDHRQRDSVAGAGLPPLPAGGDG